MPAIVPVDPIPVALSILTAEGLNAHGEITAAALSSPGYIAVTEASGTAAHTRYSYSASVQVVAYSSAGRVAARTLCWQAIQVLSEAAFSSRVTEFGGLHAVTVDVAPYPQAIQGLPPGVARVFSTLSVLTSSTLKWDQAPIS